MVEKYNLEAIATFMKDKFANLGRTYQLSNLSQIRILLSSITPSGLAWSDLDLSNSEISPLYQQIRMFEYEGVAPSADESTYFEPLQQFLDHSIQFMNAYQAAEQ